MRDELSPRVGHMLADRLREAARIMAGVRETMMMVEMPYVLAQELWELEQELSGHSQGLREMAFKLSILTDRIEAEDNVWPEGS
jgi:hypothetical protein